MGLLIALSRTLRVTVSYLETEKLKNKKNARDVGRYDIYLEYERFVNFGVARLLSKFCLHVTSRIWQETEPANKYIHQLSFNRKQFVVGLVSPIIRIYILILIDNIIYQ